MAATRLSDSQKQELVARFRLGEAAQVLAEAFGCSANTVSRVVRTALDPKDYETLKQQRVRSSSQAPAVSSLQLPLPNGEADSEEVLANTAILAKGGTDSPETLPDPGLGAESTAMHAPLNASSSPLGAGVEPTSAKQEPRFGAWLRRHAPEAEPLPHADHQGASGTAPPEFGAKGAEPDSLEAPAPEPGHAALALDDADDFADDFIDGAGDDSDGDSSDDGDSFRGDYGGVGDAYGQTFVVLPLGQAIEDRPSLAVQPLNPATLPASVYMLVDKTVELDIKPLKELTELGSLPAGEGDRQALVVYANPRQAKRFCGRNQRVIKVPDSGVLARTAPYLLSQGVTRLVVEGALYSLPGS
ncbi:MAG: hypothetical protein NTZ53_00055 [Cyanobacteria bacterium]|nr:hypothetical protein [Cyanobacteriota bacterium]